LGRFDEAEAALNEALSATDDGSQPAARVEALLARTNLAITKGARGRDQEADVEEALAIAEATGDPRSLAMTRLTLSGRATFYGRQEEAKREDELAIDSAQRAGDLRLEAEARVGLGFDTLMATSTASDIDRIHAENLAFARKHNLLWLKSAVLRGQSVEAGRRGLHADARRFMTECLAIVEELGLPLMSAGFSIERGLIEFLAGNSVAREHVLRQGFDELRAVDERGVLSTIAADLADALIDLGRADEAEAVCTVATDAGADDDMVTQVRVRLVRARLAALHGSMTDALASAADGMALADQGEVYDLRTGSRLVLAQLLLDTGRLDEARKRAEEVVDLARVRGDVVFEARAGRLIERTAVGESSSH
jgi:tetratricopeptide (TPR) repeat protein